MTTPTGLIADNPHLADLDPAARRLEVRRLLAEGQDDPSADIQAIVDDLDGYGPLGCLMRDELVTDVLINGPHDVWIERAGMMERTEVCFDDVDHLRTFILRWTSNAGNRVDTSKPEADGSMLDGSRVHIVLPPLAPTGPLVSIRRFPAKQLSLERLAELGLMNERDMRSLEDAVTRRSSIVISGATGSGKTSLLGALLSRCAPDERIVTIEEAAELRPSHPHIVPLMTRKPNVEGMGQVDATALTRAALRMRPDRIVVGEVRGPEALPALMAISTGHEGSMMTVHASSAAAVPGRLVSLCLQADSGADENSLRRMVTDAFDVYVHLERRDGVRRVVEIEHRDG